MDTHDIECPDCHYSRSVNLSDLPSVNVSATCPRCGRKFPLPPRRRSPRPVPKEIAAPRSGIFPFTFSRSFLLTVALLLVSLVPFVLFVGRIHSYDLPEEELTIYKAVGFQPTAEPAPNVPVLIEVILWKRWAFYWGDGANGGEQFKSVHFYTFTDSSGKLRVPGTRHRVFVSVPWSKSVSETYCYHVENGVAPKPEDERPDRCYSGGPIKFIESPRDLVCVRRFELKPAAEISKLLENGSVIPLTALDDPSLRSYRRRK